LSVLAAKLPDAPTSLADVPATTSSTQVGLSWSDGAYNGGSAVIDYQVSFTEASSDTYSVFASGITSQTATVTGLTAGTSYKFIVKSRNIVDFSLASSSVTILAAQIPDAPTSLSNVEATTDADTVGLSWTAPSFDGGSAVIDYRLWSDNASSGVTFTEVAANIAATTYTVNSLTQGQTYQFKVEARNAYGYSSTFSNTLSVLTAQVPAQPVAPTTTWNPDSVVVNWVSPDNGGSAITGYTISIRQSDSSTFSVDSTNCDMSSSVLTTCTIPVATLRASPYSLEWGTSVYAKVIAINTYGNSLESSEGNGAVITTTPGAPTSVIEDTAERTKSTLGLSWTAPTFIGGATITHYRINIAEQGQSYSVLTSVTTTTYTATGLTAGTTYEFKIESLNSYGYSSYSDVVTLLCAFVPDSPTTVATANANDKVSITWSNPTTNGSPITAYKIFVQPKGSSTFTEETSECVGSDSGVISARTCSISLTTLKASPYNLVKGDSVVAKVLSVNTYGDSVQESTGSGAVI
jgi:hypothetical protein